jgi:cell division protein FtsX
MQVIFALFLKISAILKKLFAFLSKEFFLVFIYCVFGAIITLILLVLLKYVFSNNNIYTQLIVELKSLSTEIDAEDLLLAFLFVASLGCIYLFRLLLSAVQGSLLK